MRTDLRIAVTGAAGASGQAVRSILAGQAFPAEQLRLVDHESDETIISEYAGHAVLIGALAPDSLFDRDLIFLCGGAEEGSRCLGYDLKRDAVIVDLSGATLGDPRVPVVNLEVNPDGLEHRPSIVAAPHPISLTLSEVLAPLDRRFGLERAAAVVLRPASDFGQPGIEELHRQAVSLLSFTQFPTEVFGRQLAFNIVPQASVEKPSAEMPLEKRLAREIEGVLGGSAPRVTLRALVAPVFHGHAAFVHVALSRPAEIERLREAFSAARGFTLRSTSQGAASPVETVAAQEAPMADLSPDGLSGGGFWISVVGAELSERAALNAVEIARRLLSS